MFVVWVMMEKVRDTVFLISSASLMYGLSMCGLIALIGHERTSAAKVAHWGIAGVYRVWWKEYEKER